MNMRDLDAPIFARTADALKFAFSHSEQYWEPSAQGKAMRRSGVHVRMHEGELLDSVPTGLDGAGQAALIHSQVKRLGREQVAFIVGKYAPRWFDCQCTRRCCSGSYANDEWRNAIGILVDLLQPAYTSAKLTRDRVRLITEQTMIRGRGERRGRVTFKRLGEVIDVEEHAAARYVRQADKRLAEVETGAFAAIDARLKLNRVVA